MDEGQFLFILNNQFVVRHCNAKKGNDTPTHFKCRGGLRKWSRFFYLDKGEVDFISYTGKQLHMKSGDILFLPYDIEYISSWTERTDGSYFSVEFILEYPDGRNLNLYDDLTLLLHDNGLFRAMFVEMVEIMTSNTVGYHIRVQEKLMHLFYLLATQVRRDHMGDVQLQPAFEEIEQNFHKEINVNALALQCNMSPATFRRKFLAAAGMSPIKYRNRLRLNKARELMQTGLYTVSEAAQLVGVPDVFYFSKQYKNAFGKSPSTDGVPSHTATD